MAVAATRAADTWTRVWGCSLQQHQERVHGVPAETSSLRNLLVVLLGVPLQTARAARVSAASASASQGLMEQRQNEQDAAGKRPFMFLTWLRRNLGSICKPHRQGGRA